MRPGQRPPVHDPSALEELTADYARRIAHNDLSRWQHQPPGFSCWIYLHGLDAALCVDNYQKSAFDGLAAFQEANYLARPIQEIGCPGCPSNCIKAIHPLDGVDLDPRASGIHQEIAGAMGPNIGVGDLDIVLRANNLCNQLGLDPTSLGFTISFAMELFERGLLSAQDNGGHALHFGDGAGALRLTEDIAWRRGLGNLLAEGSKRAAEQIGGDAPGMPCTSRAWSWRRSSRAARRTWRWATQWRRSGRATTSVNMTGILTRRWAGRIRWICHARWASWNASR